MDTLIGEVGDLRLDINASKTEFDAVIKLHTFLHVLKEIPAEVHPSDRHFIVKNLKIDTIDTLENVNFLSIPYQMVNLHDSNHEEILIKKLSLKHDMSFENFLAPQTSMCYECEKPLTKIHTKGTNIQCATLAGMQTGTKFTYRCRECSIIYKYDMYTKGNKSYFYPKETKFVRASNIMFVERRKMDEYRELLQHSQTSFEAQAVSYNAAFKNSADKCKELLSHLECEEVDIQETPEFDDQGIINKCKTSILSIKYCTYIFS